jgi:hypothetical protein
MSPPAVLAELVERFESNRESYHSEQYNEAQLREEFLNPFFDALGWDVYNRKGYAEAYKEVIHEAAIKVGGRTKAPDYCFRAGGGVRSFFVEAKKPSVDIREAVAPAYQLRRYAWSAKLPVSILTDFEEFAVYDCRVRPMQSDRASTARILYLKYTDYLREWDELVGRFSPEAIRKGALDRFVASQKIKKGTAEVDAAFLEEIESWRDTLARNIALRNPEVSQRDLNFAVQRTIDRLVFLRICEDRGIESYGTLQALVNGSNIYGRLRETFQRADDRYNSGLFHFTDEKGRSEPPDELTLALTIDDRPLKEILKTLYYPESPYEFSVFPAEILGQVYEQFLGKVIRLTSGHRAVVEDKPEVKKAGGVYYTPSYIVDYIVEHTIGRLLEGDAASGKGKAQSSATLTPAQAAKLKILDPACGSGSFLIGAYQYLLDWHRDRYVEEGPEKHARGRNPRLYRSMANDWRLTTAERKRILLNNIFGVDIDPQAVEVTKLSLVLKVLEGETQQTLTNQLRLFHERALPDLGANIKCGNSLIGPDFYQNRQKNFLDEDELLRINAFDWKAEFPGVFKGVNPGFDAVIGNPPYVLLQDEFRDDEQLAYFRRSFSGASFKVDTYHLFIEQALMLSARGGRCAMITPANLLTNNHLDRLRRLMLERSCIDHIVVIDGGVFRGISVDNVVFVVSAGASSHGSFHLLHAEREEHGLRRVGDSSVRVDAVLQDEHSLFTGGVEPAARRVWEKVVKCSVPLGEVAFVNFGKQLRDRKKFTADVISAPSLEDVRAPYMPCYTGRDVGRYSLAWGNLACLDDEVARCGGCWDSERQNAKNKLLTRQIGRYPEYALDVHGYQCLNTVFMVNSRGPTYGATFLLAILNSKLLRAFWLQRFYDQRRTFPKIKGTYLKQLPIRTIDPHDKRQKAICVALVRLAEGLQVAHRKAASAHTAHVQTALERQMRATDREIDRLVYDLYGLTEEEVCIVEAATS